AGQPRQRYWASRSARAGRPRPSSYSSADQPGELLDEWHAKLCCRQHTERSWRRPYLANQKRYHGRQASHMHVHRWRGDGSLHRDGCHSGPEPLLLYRHEHVDADERWRRKPYLVKPAESERGSVALHDHVHQYVDLGQYNHECSVHFDLRRTHWFTYCQPT